MNKMLNKNNEEPMVVISIFKDNTFSILRDNRETDQAVKDIIHKFLNCELETRDIK